MARLKLLKGRPDQSEFELDQPVMVLGRSSRCDIQLARQWISARHAQINRRDNGYFITDLGSRNLTLLNGKPLEPNAEYPLSQNDLIKICDHLLLYLEEPSDSWTLASSRATAQMPLNLPPDHDEDVGSDSGIFSMIDSASGSWELRSGSNSAVKLRAMMEITRNLHDAVSLDDMLGKVLDSLLEIFAQATCAMVAVTEESEDVPRLATVRHRDLDSSARPQINQAVVANVVASKKGVMADEGSRWLMCVPLVTVGDQSLGVMQVETEKGPAKFTDLDLDLLAHIALQTSFAVESIRLHEQVRRDRELQAEMATAYHIQLSFLPTERPHVAGYSFEDFYNPAREIGGDYYHYVQLGDGRLVMAIGDVAGKGVPAALVVASLTTLLKVMFANNEPPLEVMNRLNSEFEDRFGEQLYLTMLVATLQPASGRVELINAGHLPPLLKSRSGSATLVQQRASGLALGIEPQLSYRPVELTLEPGDALLLYTDGITDAQNADGDQYRLARLQATAGKLQSRAAAMCQGILSDLWDFTGNKSQTDDICLVCVSRESG